MRAYVRLGSGGTFDLSQGLRESFVFPPSLFSIFFAAVLAVAYECLLANKAVAQDFIRIDERP